MRGRNRRRCSAVPQRISVLPSILMPPKGLFAERGSGLR